jgi:hypothetical protein
MPTRKNIKSKKSNKRFRKTRKTRRKSKQNKIRTRKSNKKKSNNNFRKTRSKRGGGQYLSKSETPEPELCPICLNDVNNPVNPDRELVIQDLGPPVTTTCLHTFHAYCLRRWCRHCNERYIEPSCPYCNQQIDPMCRFTDLEKILFDAINANRDGYSLTFAKDALDEGFNDDGTSRYDNNNILLLDINVKYADGNTPLILAVINNETDIVEILLNYGADVDAENNDGHTAVTASHDEEIHALLLRTTQPWLFDDPTDDAVEAAANRGGKRKQKKNKKKI